MMIQLAQEPAFGRAAREMAKMFEQIGKGFFEYSPAQSWVPNYNFYEGDAAYFICVDLAGVDKTKIDIHVAERVLRFRGQRASPVPVSGCERCRVHVMEIDHGVFARDIELPPDADQEGDIIARHDNGLLWITVPKRKA